MAQSWPTSPRALSSSMALADVGIPSSYQSTSTTIGVWSLRPFPIQSS
jgi:hypothetical protein